MKNKFTAWREAAGFVSQSQMSRALGVSQPLIQRFENRVALPNTEKLFAIADALGVSLDDLREHWEDAKPKKKKAKAKAKAKKKTASK